MYDYNKQKSERQLQQEEMGEGIGYLIFLALGIGAVVATYNLLKRLLEQPEYSLVSAYYSAVGAVLDFPRILGLSTYGPGQINKSMALTKYPNLELIGVVAAFLAYYILPVVILYYLTKKSMTKTSLIIAGVLVGPGALVLLFHGAKVALQWLFATA